LTPADVELSEQRYAQEHVPIAVEKLAGKIRFVASLMTGSVGQEQAPFHRIADVYFPSMQGLEACLNSPGGTPLFLIAEVESFDF